MKNALLIIILAICLNASAQTFDYIDVDTIDYKPTWEIHLGSEMFMSGDTLYCDTTALLKAKARIDLLQRSLDYQRLEYNTLKERYDVLIRERKRRNR